MLLFFMINVCGKSLNIKGNKICWFGLLQRLLYEG